MKHHDPKHASEEAFEDQPTGKWRALGAAPVAGLKSEPEETEVDPEQMIELAN
jgi:hypothetical protein